MPQPTEGGLASYYANHLAGHRTASGEPYDPRAFTCAHRTLPLGTWLRVWRADGSGAPVVVRVNDRGPASHRILLDLSLAAARRLRMIGPGVVQIQMRVVAPHALP